MPVDFTKEMKKEYSIIAPDIFPIHMGLISGIFRSYGYRTVVAKYDGKKVIDTGLKYFHNDVCYPAICSLGQQIYALTCGDYDPHKCALIQFQNSIVLHNFIVIWAGTIMPQSKAFRFQLYQTFKKHFAFCLYTYRYSIETVRSCNPKPRSELLLLNSLL